jgi:hypothetical protein
MSDLVKIFVDKTLKKNLMMFQILMSVSIRLMSFFMRFDEFTLCLLHSILHEK